MHSTQFGRDFVWGVSSSAYQSEGACLEDGKALSIWDVFTAMKGKVQGNQQAHVACNFYHRYIQDIILMQFLNIKNFRFSISWPRVFPEQTPNEKGLDFYDRVIDFCLESGIEPWVTLYHWDLPQSLEAKGGWTNRDIVGWFSDYVELCIKRYGDRVANWMVLNEPMVFTGAGYFLGLHAPGKKGLSHFLPAVHHAALCQAEGGRVIRSFSRKAKVGTTFSCSPIDPVDLSRASIEATQRVDALTNRLFIEPLLGMGYPWQTLKVLQQLEKYMLAGDEKRLQFAMDFVGLQNYTREVVQHSPIMPYVNARIVKAPKRAVPLTTMDWEIYPEGIYRMLKQFAAYPDMPPIIVTENGAAFTDQLKDDHVCDEQRIDFFERYIGQVLRAKSEGVKVEGYFAWSFTDNFEWAEGYRQRFGLVYVDYPTQKRIVKSSGFWYKQFLQAEPVGVHAKAI
jgi:beta-glucosidase